MPKCRKKTKRSCQSLKISMALIGLQVEYFLSDYIFIVHSVQGGQKNYAQKKIVLLAKQLVP